MATSTATLSSREPETSVGISPAVSAVYEDLESGIEKLHEALQDLENQLQNDPTADHLLIRQQTVGLRNCIQAATRRYKMLTNQDAIDFLRVNKRLQNPKNHSPNEMMIFKQCIKVANRRHGKSEYPGVTGYWRIEKVREFIYRDDSPIWEDISRK